MPLVVFDFLLGLGIGLLIVIGLSVMSSRLWQVSTDWRDLREMELKRPTPVGEKAYF